MKKLAINLLKSADEKLRGFGKAQNQSATVDQTKDFTFVRHQPHAPPSLQQLQRQQQERQRQKEKEEELEKFIDEHQPQLKQQPSSQQRPSSTSSRGTSTPVSPDPRYPHQQPHGHAQQQRRQQQLRARFLQGVEDTGVNVTSNNNNANNSDQIPNMAERAIRQSRRERNKTNIQRSTEELDKAEARRRSRSEGPQRRVRQSMDERGGGGVRRQGRAFHEFEDSLNSDNEEEVFRTTKPHAESDSDSDRQKWTKNPLVVRRVKKSDKVRNHEKRLSATEYSGGSSGRNNIGLSGKGDDRGSSGGDNSSSRDGTGSRSSQRFQKLEEMRKKRINMSVTSDEENTPASRISRLRQRAIQSGLGDKTRPLSNQGVSGYNGNSSRVEPHSPKVAINPYVSTTSNPINFGSISASSALTTSLQTNQNQQNNSTQFSGRFGVQPLQQQQQQQQQLYHHLQQQPFTSNPFLQQDQKSRNSNIAMTTSSKQEKYIQPTQQTQPVSVRPTNSPVLSSHVKPFYTIPDHHSHTSRALYNSSPEINKRHYMPQVRIPSADSILEVAPFPTSLQTNNLSQRVSNTPNQSSAFVAQSRKLPVNQQQQQQQPTSKPVQSSYSFKQPQQTTQFNNAVEMRLKPSQSLRDERTEGQQPKLSKSVISQRLLDQSEDSLDELIESNIQYLDRELNKAKAKRLSNIPSSVPECRKNKDIVTTFGAPSSNSGSIHLQTQQPVMQVQQNSSVQFQVALGNEPRIQGVQNLAPPSIQIARSASGGFEETQDFNSTRSLNHLQPDVVPFSERKFPRPGSEYLDREDLSKSDSQLNQPYLAPAPFGSTNRQGQQSYNRGCISDVNLTATSSLDVPLAEKGMFSDVDYDIEVCERVKKWEKYMNKPENEGGTKKAITLAPIHERSENDGLMLPSEVRKSVLLSKMENDPHYPMFEKSQNVALAVTPVSDPHSPNPVSLETNAKRFFQVIHDPQIGPTIGLESQNVTSMFQAPINIKVDKSFSSSSSELRPYFLSNQNSNAHHNLAQSQPTLQAIGYNYSASQSQDEGSPFVRRSNKLLHVEKSPGDRNSKYHEELEEIANIKDSVINLRRRFDPDSAAMTSEDDQRSVVSTASTKITHQSKLSPGIKDQDSVDFSSMIPGYENKIKDSDVWSPNLESTTAGVAVSIERVKARTLQTIPFSEDPFWKEIEKMTSFDPNSISTDEDAIKPQFVELTSSSHSSTLPTQPRQTVSSRDRLQRSKSLYTPNITPLSINVDTNARNASNALDEVLDDIRTSMERQQQLSPKKRLERNIWSSVDATSNPGYKMESGKLTFVNQLPVEVQPRPAKKIESGSIVKMRAEQPVLPSKQPMQFYQQQRMQMQQQQHKQQQKQQQNRQSQIIPGGVNGYQLDPNLLTQKLLNTGLVVETDNEEGVLGRTPSSSFGDHSAIEPTTNRSITFNPIPNTIPNPPVCASTAAPFQHAPASMSAPQSRKESLLSKSGVQSGSSALDDIQRALANFKSTPSYIPGPDSLYGTNEFESFQRPSDMDTTRGPNTKSTGWTYQSQPKNDQVVFRPTPLQIQPIQPSWTSSNNQTQKLQEVNKSMDDLKDLAQDVETRINTIKSRLHSADENSLDTILSSLKKFTPDSRFSQETPESFDDYYNRKKTKLSNALSELDRIHSSLDLKQYPPSMSGGALIPPQPKSEHLRPMQMRISSMYISGLQSNADNCEAVDKEVESEFDVISKSFQAIIDEVNKTSNAMSRSNSDMADSHGHKPFLNEIESGNQAPETQKQVLQITLQNRNNALNNESIPDELSRSPPQPAPKPQTKGSNRFRSRIQGPSDDHEDPNVKKVRSKSVPDLDMSPAVLMDSHLQSHKVSDVITPSTVQQYHPIEPPPTGEVNQEIEKTVITANVISNTSVSASTSTPPPARARTRMRPVKDNKIIQDDRAARKDPTNRVLGMPPSPQPSPKLLRKIIMNNGNNLDVTIEPPSMFQDSKVEDESDKSNFIKQQTQTSTVLNTELSKAQDKKEQPVNKISEPLPLNQNESKVGVLSTTTNLSKIPPPTLAKPASAASPTPAHPVSQIPVPSAKLVTLNTDKRGSPAASPSKARAKLKVNLCNTKEPRNAATSGSNTDVTPSSAEDNRAAKSGLQIKHKESKKELDEPANNDPAKGRRQVGNGVAMMMGKFKKDGEDVKSRSPKAESRRNVQDYNQHSDKKNLKGINNDPKQIAAPSEKQTKPTMKYSLARKDTSQKTPNKPTEIKRISSILTSAGSRPKAKPQTIINPSDKKLSDDKTVSQSGPSPPPSPGNRPPAMAWRRTMSDPDRQSPGSISSPVLNSKHKQPSKSTSDEPMVTWHKTYDTPKATMKSIQLNPGDKQVEVNRSSLRGLQPAETKARSFLPSSRAVRRRIRPTHRRIQTESTSSNPGSSGDEAFKQRPHSFHELVSNLPGYSTNQNDNVSDLRKYSSAEGLLDPPETKVYRSEQDMTNMGTRMEPEMATAVFKVGLQTVGDEGNVTA